MHMYLYIYIYIKYICTYEHSVYIKVFIIEFSIQSVYIYGIEIARFKIATNMEHEHE